MTDLERAIRRLERPAAAVAVVGMVLTPLGRRGGAWRRGLTGAIVTAGAVRAIAADVRVHGVRRGLLPASATIAATWAAEAIGVRTGQPFGRYTYTRALRPRVAAVPVHVPLAWTAMAAPAHEVARALLPTSGAAARVAVGASALTAWDVFLDPQMTAEGYWRWPNGGPYRGIPWSNFAGWLTVSALLTAMREAALDRRTPPDVGHVATYGVVAALETVAFASFLRDRGVALAGACAMLPPAALAIARATRR